MVVQRVSSSARIAPAIPARRSNAGDPRLSGDLLFLDEWFDAIGEHRTLPASLPQISEDDLGMIPPKVLRRSVIVCT